MEAKEFKLDVKAIGDEGTFEGYAAVFGNIDLGGDVIDPGAFTKTLQENSRIPILWQHDPKEPIGVTLQAQEDGKGLLVKGQLNLETTKGREAYALLKQGALKGLSIGYDAVKEVWDGAVRRLKEIRLWEWSLVTFPMNPAAQVVAVKSVVPYQDLPLADRMYEWDANKARDRVMKWAGGPDKDSIDWGKYQKAFLWYDESNAENFTAYKLPIADVIGGTLKAVPRAIFAAAAALQGARGGVDIPDADITGIKKNLERYYAKMDLTAPWVEKQDALTMPLLAIIGVADEFKHQTKVGRVFSRNNEELVKRAIEALQALLAAVEPSDDTPSDEEPKDEGKALDNILEELRRLKEVV
jgi:HK97 family phage prohead protease